MPEAAPDATFDREAVWEGKALALPVFFTRGFLLATAAPGALSLVLLAGLLWGAHFPDKTLGLVALAAFFVVLVVSAVGLRQAVVAQQGMKRALLASRDLASRLEAKERQYRELFENATEGIFQTTPSGRYLTVNPALAHMYGYESPAAMMAHFTDISRQLYVDPTRRAAFKEILADQGKAADFESEIFRKDGSTIWISEFARAVRDETWAVTRYEGMVVDITSRKRAEEQLLRERAHYQRLFEGSPQAIVLIDEQGLIIEANQEFFFLFGHAAEDIKGRRNRCLIVPEKLLSEAESFYESVFTGRPVRKQSVRMHKSGRLIPVEILGWPVVVGASIVGAYYIYTDVSERKAFEEELTRQAFHDFLTGLPNRSLLMERLSRALERAKRRPNHSFALMLMDLDRFKNVNDTLGHEAGDALLVIISREIAGCLRKEDTVARLGGDEFAVLIEEFESARQVLCVAKRIKEAVDKPYDVAGREVHVGASLGIVLNTRGYDDPGDILRDADIAMYRAKQSDRAGFKVFGKSMHRLARRTLDLEQGLRRALREGELAMHYQPIVRLADGALEGFEALIRWVHPERGIINPGEFIPLAEDTGLIVPIGQFALTEACRRLAEWLALPGANPELFMCVNISSRQLAQRTIVELVTRALVETGLPPERLKLEITESAIMDNVERSARVLEKLRALGVRVVVDDFGTGYSSLAYLQSLPLDGLKIDRSFVSGRGEEERNREIVRSILSLAASLDLSVVAEGVESEGDVRLLRALKCQSAQGYLYSRPASAEETRARFFEET